MLLLTVFKGDPLHIVLEDGREITIDLTMTKPNGGVRLGVTADKTIKVMRHRIYEETRNGCADRRLPIGVGGNEPNDK